MFSPTIRLLLIIGSMILAIAMFFRGETALGTGLLVSSALLGYGYFRTGAVYLAFKQMQKGRIPRAQKLINGIRRPDWLSPGQKAYYYFVKAALSMAHKDFDSSREHFEKSLEIGLRTEHDEAIANANLAFGQMKLGHYQSAREYFDRIKHLRYRNELQPQLDQLKEQLQG